MTAEKMELNPKLYKPELILSGSELFKYRKPVDKSLPNVGGIKDFAPDGSWLQSKKLKKFYEERLELLGEQRVERIGNLVTGGWNPEKQLVELHKELGKFWVYMGFVDSSRKWLYPEEALYLMETNAMEVSYKGLPLSIQQAYRCFFYSSITLEQYQVYTHLRRLGYVIIRHQGRFNITEYERKLKLDQHTNSKKSKSRKRKAGSDKSNITNKVKKLENNTEEDMETSDSVNKSDIAHLSNIEQKGDNEFQNDINEENIVTEGRFSSDGYGDPDHGCDMDVEVSNDDDRQDKNLRLVQECDIKERTMCDKYDRIGKTTCDRYVTYKMKLRKRTSDPDEVVNFPYPLVRDSKDVQNTQISTWNFSEIIFPDIGKDRVLHISNTDKNKALFPPGVSLPETFSFDVDKYKQKFNSNNKNKKDDKVSLDLEYSFPSCNSKPISARNWKEYKEKLKTLVDEDVVLSSPVAHLWKGDVKPLIKPCDGFKIGTLLEKLQVVKSLDVQKTQSAVPSDIQNMVIFDVYLPDCKFKKSSPGLPHHRLSVTRHSEPLPDLQTLTSLHSYYTDAIPLHWAVVDSGDIAFYDFTHVNIPVIL